MGASTYWHVCKVKELCDEPVTAAIPEVIIEKPDPLIFEDADFNLRATGNFKFAKSGPDADLGMVRPEIDSLASFLSLNPTRRLAIVGSYTSTELNSTTFFDLGIARGESVKQYLVQKGIPDSVMTVSSQVNDALVFKSDTMSGGINFGFSKVIPNSEEGLASAQKFQGLFKVMDLYFPLGSANYLKTDDNERFIEEATKFLAANKDKKLILTGYTDSEGSDDANLRLSKRRAEGVKKQLTARSLRADQIETDGKGEADPKESNETFEGRRANRRVTIVVQ
jgi:OOP family OmpA-OmpF porin